MDTTAGTASGGGESMTRAVALPTVDVAVEVRVGTTADAVTTFAAVTTLVRTIEAVTRDTDGGAPSRFAITVTTGARRAGPGTGVGAAAGAHSRPTVMPSVSAGEAAQDHANGHLRASPVTAAVAADAGVLATLQDVIESRQLGAVPLPSGGVVFRLWQRAGVEVHVNGTFSEWTPLRLIPEPPAASPCLGTGVGSDNNNPSGATAAQRSESIVQGQYYSCLVPAAKVGEQYKFTIRNDECRRWCNDPCSRLMVIADGWVRNDVVVDRHSFAFDVFSPPPLAQMVIYECHIKTLSADGTWSGAIQALDRVADLGFNVLLPLPPTQDEHQDCWGYDPLNLHAVHQPYGTPHDLKNFVNEAHKRGIAVLLDWVPNHLSSNSVLPAEYFYPDAERRETEFGPRPDYRQPHVREWLADSLIMWLGEYNFDGVRVDSVGTLRGAVNDCDGARGNLVEAWDTMQLLNELVHTRFPGKVMIAEDLKRDGQINRGGMGFDSQWDPQYFSAIKSMAEHTAVDSRKVDTGALCHHVTADAGKLVGATPNVGRAAVRARAIRGGCMPRPLVRVSRPRSHARACVTRREEVHRRRSLLDMRCAHAANSWVLDLAREAAAPVPGADTRLVYNGTHDTAVIDREGRLARAVACAMVKHGKLPADAVSDDPAALTEPPVLRACVLAAACLFTTRGVPQVLAGDECLEHRSKPWPHAPHLDTRRGDTVAAAVVACYRDLIGLRRNLGGRNLGGRNLGGTTAGLSGAGIKILHENKRDKVLVWHRWDKGGPRDDTIVVANFGAAGFDEYLFGLPRSGEWKVRFFSGCYRDTAGADPARGPCYENLKLAGGKLRAETASAGQHSGEQPASPPAPPTTLAEALDLAPPVVTRPWGHDHMPFQVAMRVPGLSITILSQDV